jgi:integrase
MYWKNGAYWYVRRNKWTRLARELPAALREYAKLEEMGGGGLDEILQIFLDDAAGQVKPSSLKGYRIYADHLSKAFAEFRPDQVSASDVAQFMRAHRDHPAKANGMRTVLKIAFDKAVLLGLAKTNPVTSVPRFKEKKRTRYITDAEYRAVQAKARPLLAVIIEVCLMTGQRIGDVLKMRRTDLDDEGVFVEQEKTGHRQKIAWSPELRAAIDVAKAYGGNVKGATVLCDHRGAPVKYSRVHMQWVRACILAGVDDAHLHDLRAKAGSDTKAEKGDSMALLGHKSEASHARYMRGLDVPVVQPTRRRKS